MSPTPLVPQKEQAEEQEAEQRRGFRRSESVEKAQVRFAGGDPRWGAAPGPSAPSSPSGPCLTPGSRAGGSVADRSEAGEPPRHLQAEGEVGTRGHSSCCPARWDVAVGTGGLPGGGGSVNNRDCRIRCTPLYLGSFRFLHIFLMRRTNAGKEPGLAACRPARLLTRSSAADETEPLRGAGARKL